MIPVLIVLAGPPCSGKSSVAAPLSRRLGVSHLSMDATRRRILPGAAHTRSDREVAYRAMHFAAEMVLRCGAGIVLDAPYGHGEDRQELARIEEATSARLVLVECHVSAEVAARRFVQRGYDPECPDLNETVVAQAALDYEYSGEGLQLDMDRLNPEHALEAVWEYLGL